MRSAKAVLMLTFVSCRVAVNINAVCVCVCVCVSRARTRVCVCLCVPVTPLRSAGFLVTAVLYPPERSISPDSHLAALSTLLIETYATQETLTALGAGSEIVARAFFLRRCVYIASVILTHQAGYPRLISKSSLSERAAAGTVVPPALAEADVVPEVLSSGNVQWASVSSAVRSIRSALKMTVNGCHKVSAWQELLFGMALVNAQVIMFRYPEQSVYLDYNQTEHSRSSCYMLASPAERLEAVDVILDVIKTSVQDLNSLGPDVLKSNPERYLISTLLTKRTGASTLYAFVKEQFPCSGTFAHRIFVQHGSRHGFCCSTPSGEPPVEYVSAVMKLLYAAGYTNFGPGTLQLLDQSEQAAIAAVARAADASTLATQAKWRSDSTSESAVASAAEAASISKSACLIVTTALTIDGRVEQLLAAQVEVSTAVESVRTLLEATYGFKAQCDSCLEAATNFCSLVRIAKKKSRCFDDLAHSATIQGSWSETVIRHVHARIVVAEQAAQTAMSSYVAVQDALECLSSRLQSMRLASCSDEVLPVSPRPLSLSTLAAGTTDAQHDFACDACPAMHVLT
jgi:hypothetical protein